MTTNHTDCDNHAKQARLGDTDEWACEGCGALMDADHPDRKATA